MLPDSSNSQDLIRFDGQVAIVTGAGRGLGREFALLLAGRGAAVVVNDIGVSPDAERYLSLSGEGQKLGADALTAGVAEAVSHQIMASGGRAAPSQADVADPTAAASIVQTALDAFGRIDVIINNAGVVPYAPLEDISSEALLTALRVHVGGAFHVTRAAWPHMKRQQYGRVVNVCSTEGVLGGSSGFTAYAAAKGGVMGLTRSLASEGDPAGIRVNGLIPGATTRGNLSVNPGYERTSIDRSPAYVAPAAVWLASQGCDVSGRFWAATAGSMREIFTSAAFGYQCPRPREFSLETVRENWEQIQSRSGAMTPARHAEYNAFRVDIYNRTVVPAE
jgi:NAD(P)-dependent dehydrogenase (short-subunit alcohol dehydrogenase family)